MTFAIGTAVGPYKIVEKLGQGGMATVYKAHHARLDRHVAIKVLHPGFSDDDSFSRRFEREARLVARLEHPHIVPVYDYAQHEGHPYLVMRFVEGQTLKERLSQGAPGGEEIRRIAGGVASGIDYAHAQGILHRDIKPSNILLTAGGGVFLADFGLARIAQAAESTLSQEMLVGTPQYISPEQARGDRELDHRADLYSLAVVLYELLAGRVPFTGDSTYSIVHDHIFTPPPAPSLLNEKVTPEAEAALLKALAKERDQRYGSAGEMVAALEQAMGEHWDDWAGATPPAIATPPTVSSVRANTAMPPQRKALAAAATVVADQVADGPARPGAEATGRRPAALLLVGGIVAIALCASGLLALAGLRRNAADSASTATAPSAAAAAQATATGVAAPTPVTVTIGPQVGATTESGEGDTLPAALRLLLAPPLNNIRTVAELEALIAADPANPALQAELAAAYARDGRAEDAAAIIRRTLPEARTALPYLAAAERLMEQGHMAMAAIILEVALEKFDNDLTLSHLLVMSYLMSRQPPGEVETLIGSMPQHAPYDILIQMGRAYLSAAAGQTEMGLTILDDALAHPENPFTASLLYLRGVALAAAGRREEATRPLQQAMLSHPPQWLRGHIQAELRALLPD